jgi:hypothetical protein
MIRDTRQATQLTSAAPTEYSINVDFNGDDTITQAPAANADGDYEQISYVLQNGNIYIEVCNVTQGVDCGFLKTVLVSNTVVIPTKTAFVFTSNHLEYDCNNDGLALQSELLTASTCGQASLTNAEVLAFLSDVDYSLRISNGTRSTDFYAHAELRNRR